jgi:hypothetical protein
MVADVESGGQSVGQAQEFEHLHVKTHEMTVDFYTRNNIYNKTTQTPHPSTTAMAPPPTADLKALNSLIASTQAILAQFTATLADNAPTPTERIANPPNPLQVFSDAARLVKAHVTKLSLLVINKPFTPSAITGVLRELASTCLPALISGVQICQQDKNVWSELLSREAQLRTRRVFRELETLLLEIKSVAQGAEARSSGGRDSLSATGVVWESCDALAELKTLGIAGLAVQKAEQWRDTIKDAIEELQEWADGEDLETEGQNDELFDSDDEGVAGDDNDSLNGLFNAANSMPADRPELKELVEKAVEKLKKVDILYRALVKRRLKTYKDMPNADDKKKSSAEHLDELMENLKALPDSIDDLASNFYDLDEEAARVALSDCVKKACETAALAKLNYEGKEDEFSTWSKKWVEAVG